ncbi:MAG: hypothetical protein NC206_06735 [Bacteroides sp.]|nr:hypothetical protein [Roseburia sp.]MCM1346766.1 hypothetical protein [Bacteroides sp.]MCM1420448.1 hypothetical protein [Bacteroides sp.]
MEKVLKNLGIAMIILGALLMILATTVTAMSDMLDQNLYTGGSLVLIILGLIVHIVANKLIVE